MRLLKNTHYEDACKEINKSLIDYFQLLVVYVHHTSRCLVIALNISFAVLLQKILTQLYKVTSLSLRSSGLAIVMRS